LIPSDFIDELLSRVDIVEIIDARVKLKKTGQNYSGLCPFHNEKTPSFSVNGDKQFYYCFGCQASGSALKFLMEHDRMDFVSAVEYLAARVGLEVPRENQSPKAIEKQKKRKSVYDILAQVSDYYRDQLKSGDGREQAVAYLKGRGLTGQIARDFALGYAPVGWDNLLQALAKTNHERDLLIEGGMVIDRSEENKTYDRFRERIMFPIRDLRGRVIAFGGRILGDGKPKYLNSPETVVFHKSRELYGLYEARQNNKKLDQLLVVEGYMDVVALAQHGVNFAVATLGTATTGEHLERLFRMVSKVVFCFDGDEAGRRAAWKALQVSLPHLKDGRAARFLFVPDGEDPDSLVRAEGSEKFLGRVEKSQPLPDFFFDKLKSEVDFDTLDGKAHLSQLAMPLINTIPRGVFKELMVGELSNLTNLTAEKLLSLADEPRPFETAQSDAPPSSPVEQAADQGYAEMDTGDDGYDDYGEFEDYDDSFHPSDYSTTASTSPMAKRALEMLLVQPELALGVEAELFAAILDGPGSGLLAEVLKVVIEQDERSPVLILSQFQTSPDFELLKDLAEKEHLLAPEDLATEFMDTLGVIVAGNRKETAAQLQKRLMSKPMSTWTDEEKDQMRSISRNLGSIGRN
jgi:DNA primase